MNKKILIIGGDPNSINSEIIYKSWRRLDDNTKNKIFLIGSYDLFSKQFKKLGLKIKIKKINKIINYNSPQNLKIFDIPLNFKHPFKVNFKDSSKYVLKCLNTAHNLVKNNYGKAIINCAIDKRLIKSSKNIGVTEFFASKCKVKKSSEIMFIYNKRLSVVPLTTHINIKNISKKISSSLIHKKLLTLDNEFNRLFKFRPKIGVLGLNPHNGELDKNSEEVRLIIPAIKRLKKRGLKVHGPLVADTIFINNYKSFFFIKG